MKRILCLFILVVGSFVGITTSAGQTVSTPVRVAFTLKNSLGYHRMFRVEGPGIAYGFTMGRNERVPQNWPVGSKLYFSQDGETVNGHILTVAADDAGKTLTTGEHDPTRHTDKRADKQRSRAVDQGVTVRFENNSFGIRRIALITYRPGETGNGTRIFTMRPYGITKEVYPVGTKVYIGRPGDPDDNQVDIVMSGQPLTGKPFLVVSEKDAGKTFKLFR